MVLAFVNRVSELKELAAAAVPGALVVVFGRRRIGKTRMLVKWLAEVDGLYTQAIEASTEIQIGQVVDDLRERLDTALTPRTWAELFELVSASGKRRVLCLDEFPYLVASDPSLPSVIQRWIDHGARRTTLILSGSSTRMMHDAFLDHAAPLYGRARKLIRVGPMSYGAFCEACKQPPNRVESFEKFALVGGVPRYWELVEKDQSPVELAEALFFGPSPVLEYEPMRLLRDEGVTGTTALSVLEAIGRGAEKPSEIAGRLATPQTALSRPLQALLDASLLVRELPYGESLRSTKRTLYRIADPTLRFWFRVYSPHRTRWRSYGAGDKRKLLHDHAATVFEDEIRARHPDAARYWEAQAEFDSVRDDRGTLVVSEIKWRSLDRSERTRLEVELATRFARTRFAASLSKVRYEVIDDSYLRELAAGE